jgi:hypothetical protein
LATFWEIECNFVVPTASQISHVSGRARRDSW